MLVQIVRPLLENAVRYGRRRVDVLLRDERTRAVVEVVDDGPGVGPDERDEIFQPGVRGSAGRDVGEGAGLGLALSRRLAQSAGGEIEVEPSVTGGRFVLRLPLG
ncbi:MAG: ATP-binding protein [Gaiellaceae bacterium]